MASSAETLTRSSRAVRFRRTLSVALLAGAAGVLAGCNIVGFVAQGIAGDGESAVAVDAQYRGLPNKSVAVVVTAGDNTLFEHPNATGAICRTVSKQLSLDIPGVKLSEPAKLLEFQRNNPYWNTLPYGDLIKRLNVDRIVYIDLAEYTTHENGNANVWRGRVSGTVGIVEADAKDPDNLAFTTRIETAYPNEKTVGVLSSDDATIQAGMVTTFSSRVSALFRDHTQQPQKK